MILTSTPASAASFGVDTLTDTVDANPGDGTCADAGGDCSLRAAIQEANASAGPDTITLAGGSTYLLTLGGTGEDAAATGDLDVTSEIDIVTTGAEAFISGNGLGDRLLDVRSGGNLDITNLVLTLGTAQSDAMASGGAVLNGGTFTATNTTMQRNSANRAGGAIEATAGSSTTLTAVTLTSNTTGNTPGNGGGFHLTGAGTVSITDSTIVQNVAGNEGGGLWNSAAGTMTVTNSTVSNNTVNGNGPGGLTFVDPDFEGGGGIHNDGAAGVGGTLTVIGGVVTANTVAVAPNQQGSGGGILNVFGTVTVRGTQIDLNSADRAGGGIETQGGNVSITGATLRGNTVDPNPGNGGGLHITGPGTVTIDDTDVSGNSAVEGGGLWNSAVGSLTVTNSSVNDNTASGASADQGGGGIYNETNGMAGGTLVVTDGEILDNVASGAAGSGGGVLNNGGNATLTNVLVDSNRANRAGGGVEAVAGNTTLDSVDLNNNDAGTTPGNGGGLHLTGAGTVNVVDSNVIDNSAVEGGGLWNSGTGTMTVDNTVLDANLATGNASDQGGGAIFNEVAMGGGSGGTLTVSNSELTDNEAIGTAGSGGAIFNNGGTATISTSDLLRNSATRAGGAIEALVGTTDVFGSDLSDNFTGGSPGNGGGLHLTGAGSVSVVQSRVTGNVASNEGGGLWNSAVGTMLVSRTLVFDNAANGAAADAGGGGLYNDGGRLDVNNTVVASNEAASSGGGVLDVNDGDTALIHVTVTDNTAPSGSGVEDKGGDTITLANSIVAGNIGGTDCAGNIVSQGGNVLGDGACDGGAFDVVGQDDPQLGADFVPTAASPAVDRGLAANGLPIDLVGNGRPAGPGFDSGALERGASPVDPTTPPTEPSFPVAPTSTTTTLPGSTPSTSTPTGPIDPTDPTVPGGPGDPGDPGTSTPAGPAPTLGTTPGVSGDGQGGSSQGGGGLARTGSSTETLRDIGLVLVATGGALVLLRRRRIAAER